MTEAEREAAIDVMAEAVWNSLRTPAHIPWDMLTEKSKDVWRRQQAPALRALLEGQYVQLREQPKPSEPVVNEGVLDRPEDEEWSELEIDISESLWMGGLLGEGVHPHDGAQFARTLISDLDDDGWVIIEKPIHPESSELGNASPKG